MAKRKRACFEILNVYLMTAKYFCTYSVGHCGWVVTLLPPISEAGLRFSTQPQVGKLVVACHWWGVYSTHP